MKVKIISSEENIEKIKNAIKNGNIEIVDNNPEFVIYEADYKKNALVGKYLDEYIMIKPNEIIYIESFGNDVICYHMNGKEYIMKEKLYEIDALFHEHGLIRINKSTIINKDSIKSIKSSLHMRFLLTLKNNKKLTVTRTYYYQFKSFIGL